MIIYSITYAIEDHIESEWITFMKEVHLPNVMELNHFKDYTFSKIRAQENTDTAFNLQLKCESEDLLSEFIQQFQTDLEKTLNSKYQGKFASFTTILEEM